MPVIEVLHVVGTRPNIPKLAPVFLALQQLDTEQAVIHTGQHHDPNLSTSLFEDLGLPEPDLNLNIGSGSSTIITAEIMKRMDNYLSSVSPKLVVVYGDVNSTLAASLASSQRGIPVAHVESGLRSFDNTMPEEFNRCLVDKMSTLLFTTSPEAACNLGREGIDSQSVFFVGNPMIDSLINILKCDLSSIYQRQRSLDSFAVATFHRPFNVDSPLKAASLVNLLQDVSSIIPIVFPLHPRGREIFKKLNLFDIPNVSVIEPMRYIDFVNLINRASLVLTDSGGIQEETTFLRVPCITLRPNTERPITISGGSNRLANIDDKAQILSDVLNIVDDRKSSYEYELPPLWDGKSGTRIARIINSFLGK